MRGNSKNTLINTDCECSSEGVMELMPEIRCTMGEEHSGTENVSVSLAAAKLVAV